MATMFFQLLPSITLVIPLYVIGRKIGMIDQPMFLVVLYMSFTLPYVIWVLNGYYKTIPSDLEQAAQIDGCGKWKTLWNITLPNVMPSITICTFLTLTNGFKLFDQNLALTAGQPANETEMLALNIFNTFYGRTGWEGVGQAKAVIFFIIVVAIALLQLRLTRSREVQQ